MKRLTKFNRLMIAVRLSPETHKKLKILCIQKEVSIQEYVTRLINDAIDEGLKGE